jgi:hypothetical protein
VLVNDTRNQHFLTRVEQKLNALNPQADARNLRIYSFEVIDRENYTLSLESPNGRPIGSNLSLFDLFSFDVPGNTRLRRNFESLFHKYENYIEAHTKSLLAKLNGGGRDIKAEIIDLFAAKLLNFVRNPFSIVKVLNSFPGVASYDPVDPALLADYRRIVSGRKPHQAHLCTQLGISDAQYVEWLRLLFMLLVPMAEGRSNFFEQEPFGEPKNKCRRVRLRIRQGPLPALRCLKKDIRVTGRCGLRFRAAWANCGRGVAHVRGSVPITENARVKSPIVAGP